MLLVFIICHLSVFVAANPFHKYPFVFLLDVGNEELEKTNSEQIRVSVPGGSIALRYPAIGFGNTIGHIRVSGIDFGTDLKASIVDGGPGYKYVVLVFMGKPGTPYEAVLTVQTVIDNNLNLQNVANSEPNMSQGEEDKNDSAEDLSDTEVSNNIKSEENNQKSNAELMQSSSNMYSYVNNESMDEAEDDDDDNNDSEYNKEDSDNNQMYSDVIGDQSLGKADFEDVSNAEDIDSEYDDDISKEDPNAHLESIDQENDENDDDDEDDAEENSDVETNLKTESAEQEPEAIDKNSYSDYEAFQEHLNYGNKIYSQEEYHKKSNYQEDPVDYVDPYGEEISEEADKYRDFNNNNYIEADDSYAIAY